MNFVVFFVLFYLAMNTASKTRAQHILSKSLRLQQLQSSAQKLKDTEKWVEENNLLNLYGLDSELSEDSLGQSGFGASAAAFSKMEDFVCIFFKEHFYELSSDGTFITHCQFVTMQITSLICSLQYYTLTLSIVNIMIKHCDPREI